MRLFMRPPQLACQLLLILRRVEKSHSWSIKYVGATICRPPIWRSNAFSGYIFFTGKRARASNARPYKSFLTVCILIVRLFDQPDLLPALKRLAGPMHLWTQKLRCRCGGGFNRFKWRVLKDGTPVYGYQCNYRTVNVSRSFVVEHNLQGQSSCDAISICEWKLELMAKLIFDRIWGDQNAAVKKAVAMIDSVSNRAAPACSVASSSAQISKLKNRKLRLAQMYADGDLGRDEYKELCAKTEQEISALQHPPAEMVAQQKAAATPSMKELTAALNRIVDLSAPKLPDSLIQEFVEVVTPIKDNLYRWKLNFGPQVPHAERTDLTKIEQDPLLKFRINFETARQYRQKTVCRASSDAVLGQI